VKLDGVGTPFALASTLRPFAREPRTIHHPRGIAADETSVEHTA
jgi:hypothetical protein